jgi:lysophospholipid acyltransferase (LPLAT)-like uncharacterized protein
MLSVVREASGGRRGSFGLDMLGRVLKWYISSVEATTRWVVDEGAEPPWKTSGPMIALTWHGRQFLGHAALRRHIHRTLLVAPHGDGQLIGNAASRAGFSIITGSGTDNPAKSIRKRGAAAFRAIMNSLSQQSAVLMTADVPKTARVAGAGAVKLAQLSGAPIHCFAAVTRNRIELHNWDRTQIVLPFGRGAIVWSTAIHVPRNANPAELEAARMDVETTLNALHDRADEILRPKS